MKKFADDARADVSIGFSMPKNHILVSNEKMPSPGDVALMVE